MIFLNRFFHPDHSATSQILSDLAFALAEEGTRVTVIASRQRYDAPEVRLPGHEVVRGVEVYRVWSSRFGRANLVGRAIDYLTFYVAAAWTLWRVVHPGEAIVAKTDPPMLSIVVAPVARLRRAKLINWMQDIYPEVAFSLGMARGGLSRQALKLLKCLRDRSIRRSATTVAIGDRMARHIAGLGVPKERIRVIPNWADGALIRPIAPETNPLRREWQLDHAFVVGYSGNLGRAHDYQTILDAIAHTEQNQRDSPPLSFRPILWLFIGGGTQYEILKCAAEARGLLSLRFQPYQPRERLAESLSVPDIHLVTLRPALEGLIVPSKFYGIAAAGRPTCFIGEKDGEIARILDRHDCGITVREGDGGRLANVVLNLVTKPALCIQMGANARTAFEHHFDKAAAIAQWSALLRQVEADESETTSSR